MGEKGRTSFSWICNNCQMLVREALGNNCPLCGCSRYPPVTFQDRHPTAHESVMAVILNYGGDST